jgi:hypothetical protein
MGRGGRAAVYPAIIEMKINGSTIKEDIRGVKPCTEMIEKRP